MMSLLILTQQGSGSRKMMLTWLQAISDYNPFWATAFLASGQSRAMAVTWVPCVVSHVVASAVLLAVAALLVRRLARREGEGAGGGIAAPVALEAVLPRGAAVPAGDGAKPQAIAGKRTARRRRDVSDHPVLWRELRRPLMARRWQRTVGTVICSLMLLWTYSAIGFENGLNREDTQIGYALVFHTLLMLLTCVLAATAIAQEKEGDQWTVLLASPLSGSAIIWGKALGVARRMVWPTALAAAHFFVFRAFGVITQPTFLMVLTVLITFNLIWIATGVALSLRCRKVTVAVIVNLALPVVLYGVVALLLTVAGYVVYDALLFVMATWL
jgi:hypothetical protein